MIEVKGKFNQALVYTENIEAGAIQQIETLCNQEFVQGSKIRIMPDVHSGAGCTIGTAMTIKDKVVPNLVGAYKPIAEIINNIQETVEIVDQIKPVYNFKAAEK